ncbi:MAG: 6,7-dimethyl-8-ribityllumazine synthase [Patescibacteria group bacterium]
MKKIAILTTEINPETITAMVEAATIEATRHEATIVTITKTLGCLDMPVIAKRLLQRKEVDGVVILGAVAQGETKHDELVVNTMTQAIVHLSLQYQKPVGFGVIGPGATREQFNHRESEYATRAVQAVMINIKLLHE